MTATPPAPGDTPEQRAARLAEGWYNSDDKTTANPGGLGDDGHVDNFPAALMDVGVVAQRVGVQAAEVAINATAADTRAGEAAASAFAAAISLAAVPAAAAAALTSSSGTNLTVSTGAKSLTVAANKGFAVGQPVVVSYSATIYMYGTVTAYTAATGALSVTVTAVTGSGTYTGWTVSVAGPAGPAGSLTGGNLSGALNETAVTLASTATTDIGGAAGNAVTITGTTTITALGTAQSGARRYLTFGGTLTLTHNAASLILPGGASIVTASGDTAEFESLGSGNWRCAAYNRASGVPLTGAGFSTIVSISASTTLTAYHLGKMLSLSGAASLTITVSPAVLGAGSFGIINLSMQYAMLTVSSGTLNGSSSLAIAPLQGAIITSDATKLVAISYSSSFSSQYLDGSKKGAGITISNNNLTATGSSSATGAVLGYSPIPVGKWAWEILVTVAGQWSGIATGAANLNGYVGGDANGWGYGDTGQKSTNGADTAYGSAISSGGTLMVLLDVTAASASTYNIKIWFKVGNVVQGGGDPVAGTAPAFTLSGVAAVYPAWSDASISAVPVGTLRFSQQSWAQSGVPGFAPLP